MRTLCDVCESAAAIMFCAADEAALCHSCDQQVHTCNKLASRHVRVRLSDPSDVPLCDICEKAPAFFYCEIDGSSLCLQCDMIVHVGGKRTHERYLLLRQRVEFPGDKPGHNEDLALQQMGTGEISRVPNHPPRLKMRASLQNYRDLPAPMLDANIEDHRDTKMIDLNTRPHRMHEQASKNQGMDVQDGNNHEFENGVPAESFKREPEM